VTMAMATIQGSIDPMLSCNDVTIDGSKVDGLVCHLRDCSAFVGEVSEQGSEEQVVSPR